MRPSWFARAAASAAKPLRAPGTPSPNSSEPRSMTPSPLQSSASHGVLALGQSLATRAPRNANAPPSCDERHRRAVKADRPAACCSRAGRPVELRAVALHLAAEQRLRTARSARRPRASNARRPIGPRARIGALVAAHPVDPRLLAAGQPVKPRRAGRQRRRMLDRRAVLDDRLGHQVLVVGRPARWVGRRQSIGALARGEHGE